MTEECRVANVEDEPGRGVVGVEEVVDALTAVLQSKSFAAAPRSRGFLAYVVTELLAGRGDRLVEHAVARHALGRPAYDARLNSSVRVQATRVRAALKRYYAEEGVGAAVRISLPPGSYVPAICRQQPSPPTGPQALDEVVVAVRRFEAAGPGAELISATVGDAIVDRLAAFAGLRVLLPGDGASTRPEAARFLLSGRVSASDGVVRLEAELCDVVGGDLVWNVAESLPADDFDASTLEARWAATVAAQIGDSTGIIFRRDLLGEVRPDSAVYAARLAYTDYLMKGTSESVATAAAAVDRALAGRRSADLLAMRGALHNAEANQGTSGVDPDQELLRAEALAREALAHDPQHAPAYLVLGGTAWQRHDWDIAHAHATRAVELAPCHPTILMSAGTVMAVAGDWEGGVAVLRQGFRLNPRHAGHAHAIPAIACLMSGDDAGALAEASLVHSPGQLWGPLYRAMALAGLGYTEQAWGEMSEVLELDPGFLDDPSGYFTSGARLSAEQLEFLLAHFEPFASGPPI